MKSQESETSKTFVITRKKVVMFGSPDQDEEEKEPEARREDETHRTRWNYNFIHLFLRIP